MKKTYYIAFLVLCILSSCITQKDATNFQGPGFASATARQYSNKRTPYRIQPNDVLNIQVKGLEKDDYDFLNLKPEGMFNAFDRAALFINGYSVSDSGYVHLPIIGNLKVVNLTLNDARNLIQRAVDKQLKNSTVFVTMISFKVSVLGEVKTPGQYFNYTNQLTILEALALAGDVTDFGDRKHVLLIRQTEAGNEAVRLNLTDPNLVVSKYYYLLPNDVLYIQPLKAKFGRQNANNILIVSSVIGTLALIGGLLYNITK